MNKSELIDRWQDPGFTSQSFPILDRLLVQKHEVEGADLRGLILGLEGEPEAYLYKDFQGAALVDSDLSFAQLSCSLSRCRMVRVKMKSTYFDTCRFKESHFEECSFAESHWESPSLLDTQFVECVFSDMKMTGRGQQQYGGKRVAFVRCKFVGMRFSKLQLRAWRFFDCDFSDVTFKKCIVTGTQFNGSAPPGSAFVACELASCSTDGVEWI